MSQPVSEQVTQEDKDALNALVNGGEAKESEVSEEAKTDTEATASENTETEESAQTEGDGTDWKAEARKWESRSKENKEKADAHDALASRISELEADGKTKEETLNKVNRENTILRLRLKHNVSEEDASLFLTAGDEETLEKQAERLSQNSARSPRPDAAQGTRNDSGPLSVKQQGAATLESLFN